VAARSLLVSSAHSTRRAPWVAHGVIHWSRSNPASRAAWRVTRGRDGAPAPPTPELPAARLFAAGLRGLPLGAGRCRHFHERTTRYDHDQKMLSFLLVCRVCGIEQLVHRQPYLTRSEAHPARGLSP
jgi:hypothetical protein